MSVKKNDKYEVCIRCNSCPAILGTFLAEKLISNRVFEIFFRSISNTAEAQSIFNHFFIIEFRHLQTLMVGGFNALMGELYVMIWVEMLPLGCQNSGEKNGN